MLKQVSWYVFALVGMVIGLGAFGHGFEVRRVHEAIDKNSIEPAMYQTLILVWYFLSGTMFVFGATILWIAFRLRAGDASALFAN